MIQEFHTISNNSVAVTWQKDPEFVVVARLPDMKMQKMFAGFEGVKELFESFIQSFSEQTDYETASNFFKPNTQQQFVNK
jgi:hypothetical protein